MFKFLLAVSLLISSVCYAQDTSNTVNKSEDTSVLKSAKNNAQHFTDSLQSIQQDNDAMQNINNLVRYQKEQNAKKKSRPFYTLD